MADPKLIDIAVEIRHETARAYLVYDGHGDQWVPKSIVEVNDDGTITLPEWLAKQKGFI